MRLDLESSRPAFNNQKDLQNFSEQGQNRHIISRMWFWPFVFLQQSCLLNAGLVHSRSDIVFKKRRLHNNIFSECSAEYLSNVLFYFFTGLKNPTLYQLVKFGAQFTPMHKTNISESWYFVYFVYQDDHHLDG